MSKPKHTQLKWILSTQGNRIITPDDGPDYEIASCTGMDSGHPAPEEEQFANARLITAAPEMLELLKTQREFLLVSLEDIRSGTYEAVGKTILTTAVEKLIAHTDAVIAKAEGKGK